jgi:hypothetical protein
MTKKRQMEARKVIKKDRMPPSPTHTNVGKEM